MGTKEKEFEGIKASGFGGILALIIVIGVCVYLVSLLQEWSVPLGMITLFLSIPFICFGFTIIEPNDAKAMVFFGKYKGTITDNGFFWVIPFYQRKKITLRARNLDVPPIKVNDKVGNPVMIGAVMVWRVKDTYKALFDIDSSSITTSQAATPHQLIAIHAGFDKMARLMQSFENFVKIQSDAAIRQIAGMYAYDTNESSDKITLRSDGDEVAHKLEEELNRRLAIAGIEVVEARINYLAYASEIAGVMLRRQQADAIISARERIVEGAVTMVQLALDKLEKDGIVALDEDKKAAMVSNLLVVLCSDEAAQPVLNTGTLHQ
jgi:regulator of protease activity HflC (stomatin/prohibitin superfamily)